MARIRTTKPEFWTSEQVMECSPLARLVFLGMWNFCDDAGVHPASPKTLKAEIFPSDDISAIQIVEWVAELIGQGLLEEYEVDGRRYWIVTGWHHQKIDQPTYKHPRQDGTVPAGAPKRRAAQQKPQVREAFAEQSPNARQLLDGCSPPEGNGKEGSGQERKDPPFIPPPGGNASPARNQRSEMVTFAVWCKQTKARGEKLVSQWEPLREYAKSVQIPSDFIALAWNVFCTRFEHDEKAKKKRYTNWRMTFLNYVKGNYLRLWAWSDRDGCFVLTTVGQQADREHREAA
jgi:hypothetical protein